MGIELIKKKNNLNFQDQNGNIELTVPIKSAGSNIELDTTLTIEGAAADSKATGDAIGEVKQNATTTEYHSITLKPLVEGGYGHATASVIKPNSSNYTLSVGVVLGICLFENGVEHRIINAPFDFIYVGSAIWVNKHQFKRVGITSPVITENLGFNGVIWFDYMGEILSDFGMNSNSYNFTFEDSSKYTNTGTISAVFTINTDSNESVPAYTIQYLFNEMFKHPETKLVFEYQKQENIKTIEATYNYDVAPAGGIVNEY